MDQLKLLMDYTKFHIGVYLSLGTASLTLYKVGKLPAIEILPGFALMFLAGAAGGIIASSIPEHESWESFMESKLEVFGLKTVGYKFWSKVEHYSFWLAIFVTSILVGLSAN